MAVRGFFKPQNPGKYKGDPTKIVFRSSWEVKVMKRLDRDPNIVEWSSEEIIISYRDRSTGRLRRYFPDFFYKRTDGACFVVEVKPYKETIPPIRTTQTDKRFITECMTYAKNISKWEAAERWCDKRGWKFIKLTEKQLGIK